MLSPNLTKISGYYSRETIWWFILDLTINSRLIPLNEINQIEQDLLSPFLAINVVKQWGNCHCILL